VSTISAELAVSGSAGGQRLRGRVLAGLAAPASALLDAAAPFGASLFIYAARDGAATLLLPRDGRVLRGGDPAAVLEAVTGVPLAADDLRLTLTGCARESAVTSGRAFGDSWRGVSLASGEAFLHRDSPNAPWRLVAAVYSGSGGGWRADYLAFEDGLPRNIRLVSGDRGRRFNLRLTLSQVDVNPPLGPDVFEPTIPDSAVPISLQELREAGGWLAP
jgi:hypothetical protein